MNCRPSELQCALEAALRNVFMRGEMNLGRTTEAGVRSAGPLSITPLTLASGSAYERDVFRAGEAVAVLYGGRVDYSLVLEQRDGGSITLPALNGVYPIPHHRVAVDTNGTSLDQDMVLLHGPSKLLAALAFQSENPWEPYEVPVQMAGNVNTDVTVEAGYDYKLECIQVQLDNDATAAARRMQANVYNADGSTSTYYTRAPDDQGASENGLWLLLPGAALLSARTLSIDAFMCDPACYTARIPVGQSNLIAFRISVSAGVAGDTVDVVGKFMRRRLP